MTWTSSYPHAITSPCRSITRLSCSANSYHTSSSIYTYCNSQSTDPSQLQHITDKVHEKNVSFQLRKYQCFSFGLSETESNQRVIWNWSKLFVFYLDNLQSKGLQRKVKFKFWQEMNRSKRVFEVFSFGGTQTWLRLLLIPWWLVVEKSASFFEGCCDGLLPRGH